MNGTPEHTPPPSLSTPLLLQVDQLVRAFSSIHESGRSGTAADIVHNDLVSTLRKLSQVHFDDHTPDWLVSAPDAGLGLLWKSIDGAADLEVDNQLWLVLANELEESGLRHKLQSISAPHDDIKSTVQSTDDLDRCSFTAVHDPSGRQVRLDFACEFSDQRAPDDEQAVEHTWKHRVTVAANGLPKSVLDSFSNGLDDAIKMLRDIGFSDLQVTKIAHVKIYPGTHQTSRLPVLPGNARLVLATAAIKHALELPEDFSPDSSLRDGQTEAGFQLLQARLAELGQKWLEVRRAVALAGLRSRKWELSSTSGEDERCASTPEGARLKVVTRQQEILVNHFSTNPHQPALLGGGASSGKTTTAALVAEELSSGNQWRTLFLRPLSHTSLRPGNLLEAVRLAHIAAPPSDAERSLVVVDEVAPTEDFNDLAEELVNRDVPRGTSILVLALYGDHGGEWQTDGLRQVTINTNSKDRIDFTRRLFEQSRHREQEFAPLLKPLVNFAGTDRWLLTRSASEVMAVMARSADSPAASRKQLRSMTGANLKPSGRRALSAKALSALGQVIGYDHATAAPGTTGPNLQDTPQHAWISARVPSEHTQALRYLALLSMLRTGVSDTAVVTVPPTVLVSLGAARRAYGWRLTSVPIARAVYIHTLSQTESFSSTAQFKVNDSYLNKQILFDLVKYLEPVSVSEPAEASKIIFASRLIGEFAPRKLTDRFGKKIIASISLVPTAETCSRVLNDLYPFLDHPSRLALLRMMFKDLSAGGFATLEHDIAMQCLAVMRRDEEFMCSHDDDQALFNDVVQVVAQDLEALAERLSPPESVELLMTARRIPDPQVAHAALNAAQAAFSWSDPTRIDHYRALVSLVRALRDVDDSIVLISNLRGAKGCADLLDASPGDLECGLFLSRLGARIAVGEDPTDNAADMEEWVKLLASALRTADAQDFLAGILVLRRATRKVLAPLLGSLDLTDRLHQMLVRSPADTITEVLRLLYQNAPHQAWHLLYDQSGRIRRAFISAWVSRISTDADLREVGKALQLTAQIDSLEIRLSEHAAHHDIEEFSRALADSLILGVEAALNHEDRPEVVRHVLQGLIACNTPAEDLERLRANCSRILLDGAANGIQEGAARLALRLSHEDAFGPAFLEPLHKALTERPGTRHRRDEDSSAEKLVEILLRVGMPSHIEALHRLVLAMSPEAAQAFERDFNAISFLRGLPIQRSLDTMRALTAVSKTLSYAGRTSAGQELLDLTGGTREWEVKLRQIRNIHHFIECVDLLGDMSAEESRRVIDFLNQQRSTRSAGQLTPRRNSAPEPSRLRMLMKQAGSSVTTLRMLRSVSKTSPDVARKLANSYANGKWWEHDILTLIDTAEPAELGKLLRDAARLHIELSDGAVNRLAQRWTTELQGVRGVWSLTELLRGVHATAPEVAVQITEQIRFDLLKRRVEQGRVDELLKMGSLLNVLRLIGAEAQAGDLLDAVPIRAFNRIEAAELAEFGVTCSEMAVDGHQALELCDLLQERRSTLISSRFTLDRSELSISAGFVSMAMMALGRDPEEAECRLATNHPAARLWMRAFSITPSINSSDDPRDDYDKVSGQDLRQWAAAALLCCAATDGTLGELDEDHARNLTTRALGASPKWLFALMLFSERFSDLSRLLAPRTYEIEQSLDTACRFSVDGSAAARSTFNRLFSTPHDLHDL